MLIDFTLRPDSVFFWEERPVVVIRTVDEICIPIWVESSEAEAIKRQLAINESLSPTTPDLGEKILSRFGHRVTRLVITELRAKGYAATLFTSENDTETAMDAMRSDLIVVALRWRTRMLIEESVVVAALDNEKTKEFLEELQEAKPSAMQIEDE